MALLFCVYNKSMENYDENYWKAPCPSLDCRGEKCKCSLKYIDIPSSLGDDSASSPSAPKNGSYCNAIVKYEANGAVYIYSTEGVPVKIKEGN